jgi:hypothetical protein
MKYGLFFLFAGLALTTPQIFALERSASLPYDFNNALQRNVFVPQCTENQYVGVSGSIFVCRDKSGAHIQRTPEVRTPTACSNTTSASLGQHSFCAITARLQSSGESGANFQCWITVDNDNNWTLYAHTDGQCITCGATCLDF